MKYADISANSFGKRLGEDIYHGDHYEERQKGDCRCDDDPADERMCRRSLSAGSRDDQIFCRCSCHESNLISICTDAMDHLAREARLVAAHPPFEAIDREKYKKREEKQNRADRGRLR